MSLKDIFEKIPSTLKEIGTNIINFDLTKLGSEDVVVPVMIFSTMIAYYFIYQITDDNFIVKRFFNKYGDIIDSLNKWYLLPLRLILLMVGLYLYIIILFLPTMIITMVFY